MTGIFAGLLIGVLIAGGVAFLINFGPTPFKTRSDAVAVPEKVQEKSAEPIELPGKPGDKPMVKPRFDFYKVLPEGEGTTSLPSAEQSTDTVPDTPARNEKLYLQLGAFQDPVEADNLKARLALMGYEALVQQVDNPDKGTLHRVRIGPYSSTVDMGAVRAQLAAEGLNASVVKNNK